MQDTVDGNPNNEAELKDQITPERIISGTGFLSSSDADWIAGAATIIVGGIAGLLARLGHDEITDWLWGLTIWLGLVAVICRANEHGWKWLAPIIAGRPGRLVSLAFAIVLACTVTVRLNSSEAINHELLGPMHPEVVFLKPGRTVAVEWQTKNFSSIPIHLIGFTSGIDIRPKGDNDFECEIRKAQKLAPHHGPAMDVPPGEVVGALITRPQSLSETDEKAITTGDKELYSFYAAVYKDSNGQIRTSTSCIRFDAEKQSAFFSPEYHSLGKAVDWESINVPKRATIKVVDCRLNTLRVSQPIDVRVHIENQSADTAKNVRYTGEFEVVRKTDEFDEFIAEVFNIYENDVELSGGDDLPAISLMTLGVGNPDTLDLHELSAITRGEAVLLAVMRIEYDDSEGVSHWINYCATSDGKSFVPHHRYCNADNRGYDEVLGEPCNCGF